MYFKENNEFIEALFYAYYSNYEEEIKKDIINKIHIEYTNYKEKYEDFEDIKNELITKDFIPNIDEEYIIKNNGKILAIKQLLNDNILIHHLEKQKYVKKLLLIENNTCKKCNKNNQLFYYKTNFKKNCCYCTNCVEYGISNNINYHFYINKNLIIDYSKLTKPKITLSKMQDKASKIILENIKNNKNTLIWAVCGAGKTEIIYEAIYNSLKENKKICLAIPRKDIVNELYNRLKKDFKIDINILHGDKKDIYLSNIFIMTTHQLINYYDFFDLIIVDEVDAFPYSGDEILEFGTLKALKNKKGLIFLSATPSKKIQKYADEIFKIPIRYHGKLLPVPKIVVNKTLELKILYNFINNVIKNKRRTLIFVPSIEMGKFLEKEIAKSLFKIPFVYSYDEKREEKINLIYEKKENILITTTILERGITFDYLDVFVYNADHSHFSKEALIQIAGRVGRKDYDSNGEIIFFAKEKTKIIKSAIKEIKQMNELAKYRKLNKG